MALLSFVIPTRNRPELLRRTLAHLGEIDAFATRAPGSEVIVVDNASEPAARAPASLPNGLPVRVLRRPSNEGAAARNAGVEAARGAWIVMLDDDSHPLGAGLLDAINDAAEDVAAIGAEIFLPNGAHEAGGLPEVFVGCGAAIRRDAFLRTSGYDPAFEYYAEEYDLCAKLLLDGGRVVHDARFSVAHEKTTQGRDMDAILRRLVRNNAWVAMRYAPDAARRDTVAQTIARYSKIAVKERAVAGCLKGIAELGLTARKQTRREMPEGTWDRFTGLACARRCFALARELGGGARAAVAHEGKHAWAIRLALEELGVRLVEDEREADVLVVGTLSPGPATDALLARRAEGRRVVAAFAFGAARMAGRIVEPTPLAPHIAIPAA